MSSSGTLELRLGDFLDEIATADPMPGSGFVAGFGVAMAAGLVSMAARLSRGHWAEASAVAAQAESLRGRAGLFAERNSRVYEHALATLRGNGEVGRVSRDEQIASALDEAAWVPLQIAEVAADVTALAASVAERGEASVRADAVAAALLAHASARAAATLVEVNLGTTPTDERLVRARDVAGTAGMALDRALATVT